VAQAAAAGAGVAAGVSGGDPALKIVFILASLSSQNQHAVIRFIEFSDSDGVPPD
jgi:hypothetical protein